VKTSKKEKKHDSLGLFFKWGKQVQAERRPLKKSGRDAPPGKMTTCLRSLKKRWERPEETQDGWAHEGKQSAPKGSLGSSVRAETLEHHRRSPKRKKLRALSTMLTIRGRVGTHGFRHLTHQKRLDLYFTEERRVSEIVFLNNVRWILG